MKKNWLEFLVFVDAVFGGSLFIGGIIKTFSDPTLGWMCILLGLCGLLNFYYLLWGVEEIILDESKQD